jgi:hypothetical protein
MLLRMLLNDLSSCPCQLLLAGFRDFVGGKVSCPYSGVIRELLEEE